MQGYTMTTAAAAERLGVHLSSVSRWANKGQIPFVKTPGGWKKFRPEDIERFAASLEREQTA